MGKMSANIIMGEEIEFPKNIPGLGHLYFHRMQEHAKNNLIAQIDAETGEEDSYASLLKRSVRTALYLQEKGIKKEDIICFIGSNNFNSCVPFVASHFIGAVPISITTIMPDDEFNYLIDLIDVKMLFVTSDKVDLVRRTLKEVNKNPEIIVIGDQNHENLTKFSDVIKEHGGEETFQPVEIQNLNDTAIIYCSSGVSSRPKVICLSHRAMLLTIFAPTTLTPKNPDVEAMRFNASKINKQLVVLMYKQLSWISAGLILSKMLFYGIKLIIADKFDPEKVWYRIEKYRVNMINMQVSHFIRLYKNGRPQRNVDTSSLFNMICGGAHVHSNILLGLRKLFPTTLIFHCYAQTELAGVNTYFDTTDKDHRKCIEDNPECVGFAGPWVTYKIVDPDTNSILEPNQPGEIRVKSPTMMNGYYKTDSAPYFDEDGYFKTGDIGYYDDEKRFYIVDGIKDFFRNGVLGISPFQIEKIVYLHPAVKEATVLGVPRLDAGDDLAVAAVVLRENMQVTPREIEEFVNARVDATRRLSGGVRFLKEIPKGANGKVNVRKLRAMVVNGII